MHCQLGVQAFRNFDYDANIFRGFFFLRKYVYFFFEDVKHQVNKEENERKKHKPENDSHVVDEREVLVSNNWKRRSLKFCSINARFQTQKIVSDYLE